MSKEYDKKEQDRINEMLAEAVEQEDFYDMDFDEDQLDWTPEVETAIIRAFLTGMHDLITSNQLEDGDFPMVVIGIAGTNRKLGICLPTENELAQQDLEPKEGLS